MTRLVTRSCAPLSRWMVLAVLASLGWAFPCGADCLTVPYPYGVAAADVTLDGHDDLVVSTADSLYIFAGDGAGGFAGASASQPIYHFATSPIVAHTSD